VLAKALGGGMPLGAFVSSKILMDQISIAPELGHLTTFGGHPVSCAAALASLEFLTETILLDSVEIKGEQFIRRLEENPGIAEIRSKGLMLGVEIRDPENRRKLNGKLLDAGIITDWFLFHPGTFRIAPPLTISKEEIDLACDRILRCLDETG
jgi:acetylornithine/succinyldiaminopimelate/putrescine aminotransferase